MSDTQVFSGSSGGVGGTNKSEPAPIELLQEIVDNGGGGGGGGGGGAITSPALGVPADTPATDDTGTFSLVALVKRGLINWTTLLGRIPALSGGKVPVVGPLTDTELRAGPVSIAGIVGVSNTVAVSAAALPLPAGAATDATLVTIANRTPALGQSTMANSQPVVVASDQGTLPVQNPLLSATGSLAATNAAVALTLNGYLGFAVDLRGTFVATVTIQATIDGTNWFTVAVIPAGSGANVASVTAPTAPGAWVGNAIGYQQVRAIATSYTSGTVNVTLRAVPSAAVSYTLSGGQTTQAVSGTVTVGSITAGTNVIGLVRLSANAGDGPTTTLRRIMTADTNSVSIKASAAQINSLQICNETATKFYLKIYNKASAPVLTSDTPVFTIPVAANAVVNFDTGPYGIRLATGFAIAVTGGLADTDTSTVALNAGIINCTYS